MLLYLLISIVVLFVVLLLTILYILHYHGLFDCIEIKNGRSSFDYGERSIVYKVDCGQYNDSSWIFNEICSILPNSTTFGMYVSFDSLDEKVQQKILSKSVGKIAYVFMVGAIVSSNRLETNDTSTSNLLQSRKYRFSSLPPSVDSVCCRFPFKGVLSVVIASRRVYSALDEYLKVNWIDFLNLNFL